MKFEICTTSWNFGDSPEKILEKYPMLKDFGFEIEEIEYAYAKHIQDENGNYIIQEIPKTQKIAVIQIHDLSELIALRNSIDQELIITHRNINNSWCIDPKYPVIEIYDTWRE